MSKIKIEEIESVTTASPNSGNLTITPNGSGVFEVAGEEGVDDGTLQLNSAGNTNKIKIKSPNRSAAQNYTMILPTTSPTADTFLKVDSISGSGSTAVGQLGYHTHVPADLTQLDANNFDSGTISPDRYSLKGTQGAGFQFVQKQTVTESNSITALDFTNLEDGGLYKMYVTKIDSTQNSYPRLLILDENGSIINSRLQYEYIYENSYLYTSSVNSSSLLLYPDATRAYGFSFEIEFYTKTPTISNQSPSFIMVRGVGNTAADSFYQGYASLREYASNSSNFTNNRFYGIRIYSGSSSYYLETNTEIVLYKYNKNL